MSENINLLHKLHQNDLSNYDNLNGLFEACRYVLPEDETLAVKTAKEINNLALINSLTASRFYDLYNRSLLFLAQNKDFDSYMLYIEKNRDAKNRFYLPRRKQFAKFGLVQAMQDLIDDKLDILSISMPPGTAKTTLGEFFISAIMGYAPMDYNLMESHSGHVTRMFFDATQNIISSNEYCWSEVFPNVKIDEYNAKNKQSILTVISLLNH